MYECLRDIEFIDYCNKNDVQAFSLILCDDYRYYSKYGRNRTYKTLWNTFRNDGQLDKTTISVINNENTNNKFPCVSISSEVYFANWLQLPKLTSYKDECGNNLELRYILN